MAVKEAVTHPSMPDYSAVFNWGVKLGDFDELFLLAGFGAHDAQGIAQHEGDPVAQTRYILDLAERFLDSAGYTKNEIIRVEFTMVKGVLPDAFDGIFGAFAEWFGPLEVKPAAGTLRVVDALAIPGMLVEYEFWCAR